MNTFEQIKEQNEQNICQTYARYPLAIIRGQGCSLFDQNNKEYIDLLSGIGVCALGHCHEELCKVIEDQSKKLWHVSNLFYQEEQNELAQLLLSTTHHEKAFFCNSGAEANEALIKIARRYMRDIKKRDAYEIITLEDCFHGRTYGALAATKRENLTHGFLPLPEGFIQVKAGDLEELNDKINEKTAAVLVEVVQGEGGVIPLRPDYLKGVALLCRKNDILFLCDEVQTGMCRTGTFWAFQQYNLKPDGISVAKTLANGIPMGAILVTNELSNAFTFGAHATTFGGGAIASAVAKKVVEICLRDKLTNRATNLGNHLKKSLENLKSSKPNKIKEIRSLGLMVGIDLGYDATEVWKKLLEKGFITNLCHKTVLRLLPPLIIKRDDLDNFVQALNDCL